MYKKTILERRIKHTYKIHLCSCVIFIVVQNEAKIEAIDNNRDWNTLMGQFHDDLFENGHATMGSLACGE